MPSEQTNRRGRRSAEQARETREQILNAAQSCFAKWGFTGTTNQQIAEAAGLTAGALYNHFANKSDLYVAVCVRAEQEVTRQHRRAVHGQRSARAALCNVIDETIAMYRREPELAVFLSKVSTEIMHNEELAMPIAQSIKRSVEDILITVIEEGQRNGEINEAIAASDVVNMYLMATMGVAQSALLLGADFYIQTMDTLKALINNAVFLDSKTQPQPAQVNA